MDTTHQVPGDLEAMLTRLEEVDPADAPDLAARLADLLNLLLEGEPT